MVDKAANPLKELASGAIISLLFGVAGYAFMFLFKIFAARIFGPEDLGLFEMANTLLNIGVIVSLVGIHAGVSRYIAVYEERKEFDKLTGYLKFIFKVPVLLSLVVSAIVFFGADSINKFFGFNENFSFLIRIVSLIVPFKVINEIIYQIFYAKKRVLLQNIGSNIIERIFLVIGIIPIYFFKLSVIYAVWLLFLSTVGAFIFNLLCAKLKLKFEKTGKSVSRYKDWLFFSTPLFFSTIFAFVINWTDNIVIGKIMTSADLGIYAISFSFASFLLFFQSSFVGIFMPIMSRFYAKNNMADFLLVYKKAQNWVFALSLPFALLLIFFSRDLLEALYGKSFIGGSVPLIILTIGMLFNVYTGMNGPLIKIIKKTSFLFNVRIIMALINIILTIVLVRRIGIVGASISAALIIAGEQFIYMVKSKRYFKITHNNIVNLKFFTAGLIIILIIKILINQLGIQLGIVSLLLIVFVYLFFYFLVSFLFKVLDRKDYLIFQALIKNERQ